MRGRRALAWILTTGLGAGCSAFGSATSTPSDETSNDDGGATAEAGSLGREDADALVDGGALVDAAAPSASPDSGWVPNGGFEQQGAGCGLPWQGPGATLALDARVHSGSSACLFCSSVFATLAFNLLAPAPGNYTASAWVKVLPSDAASAAVTLRLATGSPTFSNPTSSSEWTRITATRQVGASDGSLLLSLESPSGCFLVDEVVGEYTPL